MKHQLTVLLLTLIALLAPTSAKAQSWYPPGSYCTAYGGIDDFSTWPGTWSSWVNGTGHVSIGTHLSAYSPPAAASLLMNPTDPVGSFVLIDKAFDATAQYTYFGEDICGGHFVEPNPNYGPATWGSVIAYVKPQLIGVQSGSLVVMSSSYTYLSVTPFTLPKNGPWTYVQSPWISGLPKDIIVRIAIDGKRDAMLVDDVWTLWFY